MKYVSMTFDDGRYDNYKYAFPILKKYGFNATLFCTSGYIDGTWSSEEGWKSAEKPITVNQLKELQENGWEIALHGDKHTTEINDLRECIKKIDSWFFSKEKIGFSLPNSNVDENEIQKIINSDYGNRIGYIRRGRRTDTSSLKSKILYGLFSMLKFQWAYNIFNKDNISRMNIQENYYLPSLVVKMSDEPQMIIRFIEHIPDNSHVILMLHSILPKDNLFYGRDSWCWSTDKLEVLCNELKKMLDLDKVVVDNLVNTIAKYEG